MPFGYLGVLTLHIPAGILSPIGANQALNQEKQMAMNKEIKARWVAALRSGEYKQGATYLNHAGRGFCCLGVLCDLAAEDGHGEWRQQQDDFLSYVSEGEDDSTLFPKQVAEWAGLPCGSRCGPVVEIAGVVDNLATQNDDHHRTFAEIADAIEAQL